MSYTVRGNDYARAKTYEAGILPQSLTDTVTGPEIDGLKSDYQVVIMVAVGAGVGIDSDNRFEFSVTQSTESGGTFVAADATQYDTVIIPGDSTAWDMKIDDAGEVDKIYWLNFRFKEDYRYIKTVMTKVGTPTSLLADVVVDVVGPQKRPTVG